MRKHKKLIVTVTLVCVLLLVVGGSLSALLLGGGGAEIDLAYSQSPGEVIIQVESGGGPPPLWEDYIPDFRLFGDGTVIKRDPQTNKVFMLQGKMGPADVENLLKQIKDAGFFDLQAHYGNDQIYDGSYTVITVRVASGQKQVLVYMTQVAAFANVHEAIMSAPLSGLVDYLPPEGYLMVQPYRGGDVAVLEPGTEAYAALPDMAALLAADYRTPVPVSGNNFLELKKFEGQQKYIGMVVHTGTGDLEVFPVYVPRTIAVGYN